MSFQKISVFVTALLAVTVLVLAFMAYVQLSEVRQMREDMASLQQAAETENQGLHEELASIRADVAKLDASEDLATIQQSISRLRLQNRRVSLWTMNHLSTLQVRCKIASARSVDLQLCLHCNSDVDLVVGAISRTPSAPSRRTDYDAEWPFETDEAISRMPWGRRCIAVVYRRRLSHGMDSASKGSAFLPKTDIADISVFDASSPELAAARERMIDDARNLCNAKIAR